MKICIAVDLFAGDHCGRRGRVESLVAPTRGAFGSGRYANRAGTGATVMGRHMLSEEERTLADLLLPTASR